MPARKKKSNQRRVDEVFTKAETLGKDFAAFTEAFYSRHISDDEMAYESDALMEAARIAWEAVEHYTPGKSHIDVRPTSDVARDGRPMAVVTVVNENMPFLLDSVLGDITDMSSDIYFVRHPVIRVYDTKAKKPILDAEADPAKGGTALSVIQVHLPAIDAARARELKQRQQSVLKQVRNAVSGWRSMLDRLDRAIIEFRTSPPPLKRETVEEAIEFLKWLRDDNFTFLGMRDYVFTGDAKTGELNRTDSPGLGILADPDVRVLRRGGEAVTTTPEIRAFLTGPEPLIVTKANAKAVVHRRGYMDYVGIKTFDEKGKLTGELRIVGLFTSTAYTRSVTRIPFLRSKADEVMRRSGLSPTDHSGKALLNVLESYPRDELFQIDAKILARNANIIMALGERPRLRVLSRVDPFDRFVSVLVYVPRDRYDSRVREAIGDYLKTVFDGRLSAYYPAFPEGGLARVHFIIGRSGDKTPKISDASLEDEIREMIRTWSDRFTEAIAGEEDVAALGEFANAFPETYRGTFDPDRALIDARYMAGLSADNPITVDFYRDESVPDAEAALKIFHFGDPVALSERVPLLENLGFRVISERTFTVEPNGDPVHIHDMQLENRSGGPIDLSDRGVLFEQAFMAVWSGKADNDAFNRLVQSARLSAEAVIILRACARYLQQAGIPYSQHIIADALDRYPAIARDLHALFIARLDPAKAKGGKPAPAAADIAARIDAALEDVPSLDDDRIIRRLRNVIEATLRTNAWSPQVEGRPNFVLAFKLDPQAIEGLPSPRPWREIFVYGPDVEGVHLRFGPVARGGLRWSDRALDYRTEVLGLVKAQQVKNAVIVPVGSKGGFYPRRLPAGGSRDEVFNSGRAAYITFIASLLSLTDNLDGEKVVPPQNMVRHDGDDPYFVVAADKGTATFSDTANSISAAYDFWLDDAFASGGSAGYDHKKMGITARGAWEAVKRHFREMDMDIQSEPFTVIGVGDMSGDVFGNGMLLSEHIRLIAAFDHRDIFIDPDPDPASSFKERKRLFEMGRSSWQDYDTKKISAGGGVFPRSLKSIKLSKAAQDAIGLDKAAATPSEIMRAILKMKADLLWFGGIGTYIRATSETDADAGDKANDAIRITAPQVGAKVIGEGANLGVTQKGRIEYALHGGRCNSDAIDNSAGVNSSDVEVNIKIALATAMRSGKLEREERNKLLASMTENVAALVLANNYEQTLALSLTHARGREALPYQARFMATLEKAGILDREVETLPDEAQIQERIARGEQLTRPELGVLLAYAKIVVFAELANSELVKDPYLGKDLHAYFPDKMVKAYLPEIDSHRLRKEIIATVLVNDIVNRGGPTAINRIQDLTGASAETVVRTFVIIRDAYELDEIYSAIDSLDNKVPGVTQNRFYGVVADVLRQAARWYVKNMPVSGMLEESIGQLQSARKQLEPKLMSMIPEFMATEVRHREEHYIGAGAPKALAARLALLPVSELVPQIAAVANATGTDLVEAAKTYFRITETFRIGRIEQAAETIAIGDYYDGLALLRATDMIRRARQAISIAALREYGKQKDPAEAWLLSDRTRIQETRARIEALTDSAETTLSKLTVAAGLLGDLVQN